MAAQSHHRSILSSNRTWILVGAIFGSVIGSMSWSADWKDPQVLINSSNIFLHFYINKTILGGLLGGLAGVEITKKFIHEYTSSGDLFTYPLILAMIIGRIGCFSMGVYEPTCSTTANNVFAMDLWRWPATSPVTLYEITFLLLLWIFLYQLDKNYKTCKWRLFKIFMIAYLVFRLFLDFIKPHYTFSIGLSTIQNHLHYWPVLLFPFHHTAKTIINSSCLKEIIILRLYC